jgi:hypothetical protein
MIRECMAMMSASFYPRFPESRFRSPFLDLIKGDHRIGDKKDLDWLRIAVSYIYEAIGKDIKVMPTKHIGSCVSSQIVI